MQRSPSASEGEDLFYRLCVVDLSIPALRHRAGDVPLLAAEFVSAFAQAHGRQVAGWDAEVGRALVTYSWPGNVRELAHAMERAVLLTPGRTIRLDQLPDRVRERGAESGAADAGLTLAELEERHIRRVLSLGLSQEEAARRLGIDPSTLWRELKKFGI